MELLTLPRLRNQQLQTVSEDSFKICNGLPQLEDPLAKLNQKLELFKVGMTKEKASASNKKELDNDRDNLTVNFIKAVFAESQFPYTDQLAVEALNQVVKVVKNYGFKITRLSFNEESAALDNLISDLKKIDFTPLAASGLSRWIPLIEEANKQFKDAVKEYIDSSANTTLVDSATAVAPSLMDALESLYTMLYAHLKLNATKELEMAYAQLQILLNSYR